MHSLCGVCHVPSLFWPHDIVIGGHLRDQSLFPFLKHPRRTQSSSRAPSISQLRQRNQGLRKSRSIRSMRSRNLLLESSISFWHSSSCISTRIRLPPSFSLHELHLRSARHSPPSSKGARLLPLPLLSYIHCSPKKGKASAGKAWKQP